MMLSHKANFEIYVEILRITWKKCGVHLQASPLSEILSVLYISTSAKAYIHPVI